MSAKKGNGFKPETIMSVLRWKIVDRLKELGNIVRITYGYITKSKRIALGFEKTHYNDAYLIAGENN